MKGGEIIPRIAREYSKSNVYHVIIRGNDKQNLFYDNQDRYVFLDRLKQSKEKFEFKIYSYCLMNNHVHMVIKIQKEFLSKMMNVLENRYAQYLNKKLNRTGHLYENRFYSKEIENQEYFKKCCKYIHRNPEKANIEKTERYMWSSFREYLLEKDNIIDRNTLLHYYDGNLENLVNDTLKNNDIDDIFDFGEFEIKNKLKDDELTEIILKKYRIASPLEITLMEESKIKEIIKELAKVKNISIDQICRVTRVKRYWIKKFLKEDE